MAELLLDTTFLLPLFGIDNRVPGFAEAFPKLLGERSVLYSPLSLVEAKWVALGLGRREPGLREALLGAYRQGLSVLAAESRLAATPLTDPAIEGVADRLLQKGVKDYFDRMLCATAVSRGCPLCTEDEDLLSLGKAPDGALVTMNWAAARRAPEARRP
jgi:PIN domain